MSVKKCININGHGGIFYGVSENDPYFLNHVKDNMEPEFSDIVDSVVHHDATCIDIGANIGIKTFVMAKKLQGGGGRVFSFEGAPNVAAILKKNIETNGLTNVHAECMAISDYVGESTFDDNSAWGHLAVEGTDCANPKSVPVCTVDDLFIKFNLERVDFIKIDTEGQELSVLKGMKNILRRFDPWIFLEFNSLCLAMYGNINPKDLLLFIFDNFKYVFHVNTTCNPRLEFVDKNDIIKILYKNIIQNGSVDDLLVTNNKDALDITGKLLIDDGLYNIEQARHALEQAHHELEQAHHELEHARHELEQAHHDLEQMRCSLSWRITKPLRFGRLCLRNPREAVRKLKRKFGA